MFDSFIAKRIIEGILFLSSNPLSIKDLSEVTGFKPSLISYCLKELMEDYESRGIKIRAVAGAYQMVTNPEIAPYVERFSAFSNRVSLSRPALETLAIIAYRQPMTRLEIEEMRGVNVDGVLNRLLDMKLIRIMGRAARPGRPVLFGTTPEFLKTFGLDSLDDLPDPDKLEISIKVESSEQGEEVETPSQ